MTNTADVQEMVLDNGFRVLLVERRTLPVVASMVWYRVGARDERLGETGLSHFLEHMMFKGTDRYGKGVIDLLTAKMGGSNNAFTDNDTTAYYFSLAADRWETALEIEASRMRDCLLDPVEFAAEKNVVLDELAMGEDDPWRSLYQSVDSLAFQVHPYHHPVIGWKEDVADVSVDAMRSYYERHYAPDRAFMVAVGDFDAGRLRTRIEDLFAPIAPSGEERAAVIEEPEPRGERRAVLHMPTSVRRVVVAFKTCRVGEPADFALDYASQVLGGGRSGRLFRRLVLDTGLATHVTVYNETRLDPGLFWIAAEIQDGADPAAVEAVIREELDLLMQKGITSTERRRALAQLRASFLFEEDTAMDQAMKLGRFEAQAVGGWRLLDTALETYEQTSAKDVRDAARAYLGPDRANWVFGEPDHPEPIPKPRRKRSARQRSGGQK